MKITDCKEGNFFAIDKSNYVVFETSFVDTANNRVFGTNKVQGLDSFDARDIHPVERLSIVTLDDGQTWETLDGCSLVHVFVSFDKPLAVYQNPTGVIQQAIEKGQDYPLAELVPKFFKKR